LINTYIPETNFNDLGVIEASKKIREIRDFLLQEYVDKINGIRWAAMTAEKQAEWTTYRQALLDITKSQNFPNQVTWPTKPE
jgi:hypothetical protein